jgi:hypothetical protein
MAVAARPTALLTVDGIIGPKTREAASWFTNTDMGSMLTTSTTVDALGVGSMGTNGSTTRVFLKNLQTKLNTMRYWTRFALSVPTDNPHWADSLTADGVWGPQTAGKLGGTTLFLAYGESNTLNNTRMPDLAYQNAGNDIGLFQGLLNCVLSAPPYSFKVRGAHQTSNTTASWGPTTGSFITWQKQWGTV